DSLTRLAQAISPEDVQLYYQIALGGRRDLGVAPEPRMGFEMTLLRMLAFRPDSAAAEGNGTGRTAAAGMAAGSRLRAAAAPGSVATAHAAVPASGAPDVG